MKAEIDTRTLGPERGKLGGTVIQDTWESESRRTGVLGYFVLHLNKSLPIHICICECLHMHIYKAKIKSWNISLLYRMQLYPYLDLDIYRKVKE